MNKEEKINSAQVVIAEFYHCTKEEECYHPLSAMVNEKKGEREEDFVENK